MDTTQCIWMDAKAIPYQLCPLKQNCDSCEFHKEMMAGCKGHVQNRSTALMTLREPEESLIQFYPGLQYIQGHFWYRHIGVGTIQLGVDAFVWQLLSTLHQVLTPGPLTELKLDQCFTWLLIQGGIVYLKTPIEGKVLKTNPCFLGDSELNPNLFLSPEPELWILELETGESRIGAQDPYSAEAFVSRNTEDHRKLVQLTSAPRDDHSFSLSKIAQLTKADFSRYLRIIGEGRILIC